MAKEQPTLTPADTFFMWMGRCIGYWAEIDDLLFMLFHSLVGTRQQAAVIYYSQRGFDARLQLTHRMVEATFVKQNPRKQKPPLFKEWGKLKTSIECEAKIRNRIAHQQVVGHRM